MAKKEKKKKQIVPINPIQDANLIQDIQPDKSLEEAFTRVKIREKASIWHKLRHKYYDIVPYEYRPSSMWYGIKCWWKNTTTVKITTLSRFGYHDSDILLSHVMFKVFCDFIEQECSPGCVDWYSKEWGGNKISYKGKKVFVRDLMDNIYKFWKETYLVEYPKKDAELWDRFYKLEPNTNETNLSGFAPTKAHKDILGEMWKLEEDMEDALNENLLLICRLRPYFWT